MMNSRTLIDLDETSVKMPAPAAEERAPEQRAPEQRAPEQRAPEQMAGLAKGLAILEAFGPGCRQMTVADAARETGLTRAAARRCLLTLAAEGYLAHDGKFFRPAPRLLRLGFAYLRSDPLTELAQAVLAGVRDTAGESVSLVIMEGHEAVVVGRASVSRIVSSRVDLGARLPLWCSASGRVLLAGLTPAALAALPTQIAPELLQTVRRDGYGVNDEETEPGLRALAVPVHDQAGRVRAAMSVSTAAARMDRAAMVANFLPLLRDGAAMLGRMLPGESR
jgi:IclR family pca regulon transcriptional regulator